MGITFDYVVHCSGSSSTQSGLVAGFAVLGEKTHVIGIPDDEEVIIKQARVLELANDTLELLGLSHRVTPEDVEIVAGDTSHYGKTDKKTLDGIYQLARTEGIIVDPVYEGKTLRGLMSLIENNRFEKGSKILLMHLGGTPAVHAYANQFNPIEFLNDFVPSK
jgi:1-aminocyclopropane-1-carboxylate deaminase/D-cysteine desulfhydrase-like pyridoxal-dependent ACC family enzyme